MSYKARLKVICSDSILAKSLTYSFVNETTKKSTQSDLKLDSNFCTKVFDCEKSDLVKFYLYKDKKLKVRVKVKPTLNGTYNDSVYRYPTSVDTTKTPGNNRNSKGNAVYIPYKSMQHYEDAKKNKEESQQNKKDIKAKVENSVDKVTEASGYVGVMLTGAKVLENKTFHWGMIHTKGPQLTTQRMKEITNIKIYNNNSDTDKAIQAKQNLKAQRIGPLMDKIDKQNSKIGVGGDVKDAIEIYGLAKNQDAKGLASKVGGVAGGKAGEAVGVTLAGVCLRTAAKEIANPRNALVIGGACAAAYHYSGSELGSMAGEAVGETNTAVQVATGVIEAMVIMDKLETAAAQKERERAIKSDPGLSHHPYSAD